MEASFTQISAICAGEDPQLLSARQGLSVLKSKLYLLLGWHTRLSAPPKGDRFIWILTRTFSLTSDKVLILRFIWILTRTFSLTSDKVLILKKQPK